MFDKINVKLSEKYFNKNIIVSLFPDHCIKNTKGAEFSDDLYIVI